MGRTQRSQQLLNPAQGMGQNTVTENSQLKENNSQLAKALAEAQMSYKHVVDERNYIREELYNAKVRIEQLENYIIKIRASGQESINCIVALTSHVSEMLGFCSKTTSTINASMNHLNRSLNKSQSYSISKTQAVKPMIDGHVIYSPTINLKRVNENSYAQVQPRRSTNNVQNGERLYNGPAEEENHHSSTDSFEQRSSNNRGSFRHIPGRLSQNEVDNDIESESENSEVSTHSGDIHLSINDMRLSTIQEEEMENTLSLSNRRDSLSNNSRTCTIPGTTTQMPLLSGVFRDVRVYLSPVDPLPHITKVRGSNKTHKYKSSDTRPSRASEVSSSDQNIDINETQRENLEENSSILMNSFPKNSCSSTPISSFIYNQNGSVLDGTNSSPKAKSTKGRLRIRSGDHSNPKKLVFKRSLQSSKSSMSPATDDDPLEGPSNLLETSDIDKIHTLSQLGLSPVSANISLNTTDDLLRKSNEFRQPPADKCKNQTTKKKKLEKKKNMVVSSKVAKKEKLKLPKSPRSPATRNSSQNTLRYSSEKKNRIMLQNSAEGNNSTFSNKSTQSPRLSRDVKSPIKGKRPRRAASRENYKEPSLHKKMRRSK